MHWALVYNKKKRRVWGWEGQAHLRKNQVEMKNRDNKKIQ